MVTFDSSFALHIWLDGVGSSVPKARERVAHLVMQLEDSRETIVIPTPCLAEILARAGEGGPALVSEIENSARFRIVPFDTRASVEVAQFIGGYLPRAEKRGAHSGTWAKFKFDHQIIAISKVEGVTAIYTDDNDLATLAKAAKIAAFALKDINVPATQQALFAAAGADAPRTKLLGTSPDLELSASQSETNPHGER